MITRRNLLVGGAALAAGTSVAAPFFLPKSHFDRRPKRSRVAILSADQYSDRLEGLLTNALRLFTLNVRGKTVLLKPNLVDFLAGRRHQYSSHAGPGRRRIVPSAGRKIRSRGGRPGSSARYATGSSQSGYQSLLREQGLRFVDLNRDELVRTRVRASYGSINSLWLPRAVLEADFLVSMPKIKAHHWSGVTLSLKNMFGVVPGARYGWPKNILHWNGIQQSILDLCATVPIHFVIADGVVAMEGNGPLSGTPRRLGTIVLADDPVAADATCAKLMGFDPDRIVHIAEASRFLGNSSVQRIDQVANPLVPPRVPFEVVPDFRYLQAVAS